MRRSKITKQDTVVNNGSWNGLVRGSALMARRGSFCSHKRELCKWASRAEMRFSTNKPAAQSRTCWPTFKELIVEIKWGWSWFTRVNLLYMRLLLLFFFFLDLIVIVSNFKVACWDLRKREHLNCNTLKFSNCQIGFGQTECLRQTQHLKSSMRKKQINHSDQSVGRQLWKRMFEQQYEATGRKAVIWTGKLTPGIWRGCGPCRNRHDRPARCVRFLPVWPPHPAAKHRQQERWEAFQRAGNLSWMGRGSLNMAARAGLSKKLTQTAFFRQKSLEINVSLIISRLSASLALNLGSLESLFTSLYNNVPFLRTVHLWMTSTNQKTWRSFPSRHSTQHWHQPSAMAEVKWGDTYHCDSYLCLITQLLLLWKANASHYAIKNYFT